MKLRRHEPESPVHCHLFVDVTINLPAPYLDVLPVFGKSAAYSVNTSRKDEGVAVFTFEDSATITAFLYTVIK